MFCCCRPDVVIYDAGEKIVGSVEQPCYPNFWCKYEVHCYKGDGRNESDLLWKISKCVCNCHTLFGKNCGCCSDCAKFLDFQVEPKAAAANKHIMGALQKEHFGCLNECYTMADRYNFNLPSADDDVNAIFLAAIQFLDMMYFENNYWGVGGI